MAASSFSISRRAVWLVAIRFLDGLDRRRAVREPFVERGNGYGNVRNATADTLGSEVELLELDQALQIGMHRLGGSRKNGPTRIRTWDGPVMSRRL